MRAAGWSWLFAVAMTLALGARAEPDAAQQGWLARAEVPVHWANLAAGPDWLSGPRPRRWSGSRLRSLQLRQGDVATFRIEAGTSLRLEGVRESLQHEQLVLSWSNGSGLFAQLPLSAAGDGRSLLARAPAGAPVTMRLALAPGRRTALELALFAGRDPNRITAIGYRERLVPETAGSAVRVVNRTGMRDYWRADRETPMRFAVAGPARVRIDSRLLLPREAVPGADHYRIVALLDGGAEQRFELTTLPDLAADARFEGLPQPLGRSAHAYVDIPAGAQILELRTLRPLLLRASVRRPDADYLWNANRELEAKPAAGQGEDYRAALRLAQDNARPQGGIRAFHAVAAWAERYPQQAHYHRLAERMRHRFTHYRPLLAQQAVGAGETYFTQFDTTATGSPVAPGGADSAATAMPASPARLASGWFTRLGSAGAPAREYRLPEPLRQTVLRIAVDRASVPDSAELRLQYDERAPLRVQLAPLPASTATPPGVAQVAFVEIPITGVVRRLRLWRADDGPGSPAVALAYRTSSWFRLSADGYRELIASQGEAATVHALAEALRRLSSGAPEPRGVLDDDALGTLHNQWLPLLRLLHQRYRLFDARVAPQAADAVAAPITDDGTTLDVKAARQAAAQGQWQLALERWSALAALGSAEARAGQIQALRMLGEEFLATQWLRHDLLHSTRPAWRRQALAELVALAEADDDRDEVLALRAVAAVREPDAGTLVELGAALAADHPDLALRVLLAVPEQQRPAARVLELSYRLGWWSTFDAALVATEDAALRALWQGYRAQHRGDFPTAVAHWTAAGEAGRQPAVELAAGLVLAADLAASDAATRGRARRDLAAWQQRLPGPRGWRSAQRAVVAHAGARTLVSAALGDPGDWLRATPEQPLELVVQGPVTLRFGVRPLHPPGSDGARDDWLALSAGAHQEQIPLGGNRRSSGLALIGGGGAEDGNAETGDAGGVGGGGAGAEGVGAEGAGAEGAGAKGAGAEGVGAEIAIVRELGPGQHRLALAPRRSPVLMRVAFAEALRPLLTQALPARVEVIAAREAPALPAEADVAPAVVSSDIAQPVATATAIEEAVVEETIGEEAVIEETDVEEADVEETDVEETVARETAASEPVARDGVANEAIARETIAREIDVTETVAREPVAAQSAAVAAAAPAQQPENLAARLSRLLQVQDATQDPQRRLALLVAGEALMDDAADGSRADASLRPLLQRLRRGSAWELVATAESSAGERLITLDGWHPETPELRARQTLLGAAPADGELLSGHDALVLALYNPEPVTIGVRLQAREVAAQSNLPLQALVALDEGLETVVHLGVDGQPVAQVMRVGAGHHRLRVRIAAPLVNQLLAVRFEERSDRRARPIVPHIERSYQVATAAQPVELMVEGPARLRIDEWRDGQTQVSYRNLAVGVQRVVVPVAPGRDEALIRVFRRVAAAPDRTASARPSPPAPATLAAPGAAATTQSVPPPLPLAEPQTRLLAHAGTWSLGGAAISRKAVDEEPGGAANPERFVQQTATYRHFAASDATYYEANAQVRERERGEPTLGVDGLISIRKPDWPLDVELAGSLFGQEVAGQGALATAFTLEARLARDFALGDDWTQRPSLTLFRRWLNLDAVPCGCDTEEVDQDVFTRYKDQHRQGWRLAERVSYHPWADTLLYGSARLVSNESLGPGDLDHGALDLGAMQLLGDFDLELRYTQFRYLADADRARGASAGRWRLALGFGRWLNPASGIQADLSYQYDELGGSSAALSVTRHFGEGGYYEDFVPGEIGFRSLRQRRALEQQAQEQRTREQQANRQQANRQQANQQWP